MNTDSQTFFLSGLELLSGSSLNTGSYFESLNRHFDQRPLRALLQWSLSSFGEGVVQVTSFGPTGMVLLDHLVQLQPGITVITIDTGFLFEETYVLREQVQRRYPIQLEIRKSSLTQAAQAELHHPDLPRVDPDLCCRLRKVIPLQKALQDVDAWMTGLRRDQSYTRANLPLISWDNKYDLIKMNPLAKWTRSQIWRYILEHQLPYNPLHDQGYASIGCTHCTHSTTNATDERSGRWSGMSKTECGIHY